MLIKHVISCAFSSICKKKYSFCNQKTAPKQTFSYALSEKSHCRKNGKIINSGYQKVSVVFDRYHFGDAQTKSHITFAIIMFERIFIIFLWKNARFQISVACLVILFVIEIHLKTMNKGKTYWLFSFHWIFHVINKKKSICCKINWIKLGTGFH